MKPILLIGCGGHAKSVIEVIESNSFYQVGGLVGTSNETDKSVLGYPVLGCDDDLPRLRDHFHYAFLAIGQLPSPSRRMELAQSVSNYGFIFPTLIASSAVVSAHATVGEGTVVMHNSVVNAGVIIGKHCILNTSCVVDHDSRVDSYCHISTGTLINGSVSVGRGSFIGSGSMIRECIRIPPESVISASKRVMGWPLT